MQGQQPRWLPGMIEGIPEAGFQQMDERQRGAEPLGGLTVSFDLAAAEQPPGDDDR